MKVIMFNKKIYNNQQPTLLNKANSSYRKLEKEMNKPLSEYEAIKNLWKVMKMIYIFLVINHLKILIKMLR